MSRIAALGLGAMGSRMVANLIKAGHQLTVWNRSPAAVQPLVALGAKQAATPHEAVAGAEFVMTMVRDNEASREVWLDAQNGALAGMDPDAIAIESSTLTPDWVRELAKAVAQRGIAFLEAPVSGSTPQAEAAQLVYLVGGDAATLKRAEPVLLAMGKTVNHMGAPGDGALAKLAINTLMAVQVTALSELAGMLERAGASVETVFKAMSTTPAWSPLAQRVMDSVLARNFKPQFPIALIEKDMGYTMLTVGSPELAPTIAASRAVFRRGIEQGTGQENMTAVVKLFSESAKG